MAPYSLFWSVLIELGDNEKEHISIERRLGSGLRFSYLQEKARERPWT